MHKNTRKLNKDHSFSNKCEYLDQKTPFASGLPIFNKPQIISMKENHKYKTIEESGVLASCIFQSRQALLQGFIFEKFLNTSFSKRQKNEEKIKHKISKIGEFTLRIEIFSFPETIFYLVKYITEINSYLPPSKCLEHYEDIDTPFSEKKVTNAFSNIVNNDTYSMKLEKELSISPLNSNNITETETSNYSVSFSEEKYIEFFKDYFFKIFKDDPFRLEKVNKAMNRLKEASLDLKFKEILHSIMSGQATSEQKTIFNLYIMSSQSPKMLFNCNEEQMKTLELPLFQSEKHQENENYNEENIKMKRKRKHYEYIGTEIIFEFKENPGEKWILPKDIIIERLGSDEPFEVLASFIHIPDSLSQYFQPITLKISSCDQRLWDFILKYSNKKEEVFETMSKILLGKRSEKLYFQHRLLVTDTKMFKTESENEINVISPKNKKTTNSQKKVTNKNNAVSISSINDNLASSIVLKKNKPRKYSTLLKSLYCNTCNTTKTPSKSLNLDDSETLCNTCGVRILCFINNYNNMSRRN
ncbi:hypothetical protein PORY_002852 [Pneumocystis oryctolagi]|uniref:Uncharacterized protein n=1 Tax=Pneumocystis oryctolagi TaxID=42067 RepID=A0ACB7C7W1_9ASCO|nr:hypothetical protein PORY_002852 [Pneumocystis oryctolagi]